MSDELAPAKITIIEGPTPDFEQTSELWFPGLTEGPLPIFHARTRLRTANGFALVERCHKAWRENRPALLEYRDQTGMTQHVPIHAARNVESAEGHVLMLYVALPNIDGDDDTPPDLDDLR